MAMLSYLLRLLGLCLYSFNEFIKGSARSHQAFGDSGKTNRHFSQNSCNA